MAAASESLYSRASLDLLGRMAKYAEEAATRLDRIEEGMKRQGEATLDKLSELVRSATNPSQGGGRRQDGSVQIALAREVRGLVNEIRQSRLEPPPAPPTPAGGGGNDAGKVTRIESRSLGDLGNNVKALALGLMSSLPRLLLLKPFIPVMANTVAAIVTGLGSKLKPEDIENADNASKVLSELEGSIHGLGVGLVKSIPLYALARPFVGVVGSTMRALITSVAQVAADDAKRAGDGAKALSGLSQSVFEIGKNLTLATPLLLLALPATLLLRGVAMGVSWTATMLGEKEAQIEKGASVLRSIGGSLLIFAGGVVASMALLAMAGSTSAGGGPTLALLGTIALAGVTFQAVGTLGTNINKGALSVLAMTGSLVLFALGMRVASTLMPDLGATAGTLLSLGLTAVVFGVAGLAWTQIALGALAFAATGIAMMILAPSIATLAGVYAANPHALWQIPVGLVGIGLAFALAGAGPQAVAIGAGALALGLAGAALWVIGKGLSAFPVLGPEVYESITGGIRAVVTGFGASFRDLSIAESLTMPAKILAVSGIAASLGLLGLGLRAYKSVAGSWSPEDADTLSYTLASISKAYAMAGSAQGMSQILGFSVGDNDVERGIKSTMALGANLWILSKGVAAWKNMGLSAGTAQLIGDNIARMIQVLRVPFAAIGARERTSMGQVSILGMSFNNPFNDGDVENGIDATKNLGRTLTSLAEGVRAWMPGGKGGITPGMSKLATQNALAMLTSLPSAFAAIGATDRKTQGGITLFGQEFKNPFSDGNVEKGIKLSERMTPVIRNLARLLESFVKIKDPSSFGASVGSGVFRMLSSIRRGIVQLKDSEISRFAKLIAPLQKLPQIFREVNKEVKTHVEYLAKLDPKYVQSFALWAGALDTMSKINPVQLQQTGNMGRQIGQINQGLYPQPTGGMTGFLNPTPAPTPAAPTAATPAPAAGKGTTKAQLQQQVDAQQTMMQQMSQVMQQMVGLLGSNQSELSAIRIALQSGVKIKQG